MCRSKFYAYRKFVGFFCWGRGNEQRSRFFFSLQRTFNFAWTMVSISERWLHHAFPLDSGDIYIYVSLSVSASLTAYAIHPQQLGGIKLILQQIFSTKWHCAPFRFPEVCWVFLLGKGKWTKITLFFFSPTHF
jgi:hypothetical protein